MVGRGSGRRGQSSSRTPHQHRRQPRIGMGHSDRRRADDRPPHAGADRPCRRRITMTSDATLPILKDKKALVVGVANEHSIAWGCAQAFRQLEAQVALTYVNEKTRSYVEPL